MGGGVSTEPVPWWVGVDNGFGVSGGRSEGEREQCFKRKSSDGEQRTCWWCVVACVTLFQWATVLGRERRRAAFIGGGIRILSCVTIFFNILKNI
jgi:hypothetical protein